MFLIEIIEDFSLEIPCKLLKELNPIYPRFYSFSDINRFYSISYNENSPQSYSIDIWIQQLKNQLSP